MSNQYIQRFFFFLAIFHPDGQPDNMFVYGQFTPAPFGGGVFRPKNPQQMASLPMGWYSGTVEGTGMTKIKFKLHKTVTTTSTTTTTTTTTSGSSMGFDFKFTPEIETTPTRTLKSVHSLL